MNQRETRTERDGERGRAPEQALPAAAARDEGGEQRRERARQLLDGVDEQHAAVETPPGAARRPPSRGVAPRRLGRGRQLVDEALGGRAIEPLDRQWPGGNAREAGFEALAERGVAAADGIAPDVVYAGFSFGVMIAQQLAQTRAGARGALLIYSCLPVSEFGGTWPEDVPVQVHGKEGDEFFLEDIDAARALAGSTGRAELFLYPGTEHLFADSSLPQFDPAAARLLTDRVLAFLDKVQAAEES